VPLIGGSGPAANLPAAVPALLSIALAAKASNAINLDVPVAEGTQLVGAPELTFTYSGLGTTRALYAQIVDEDSGRVLGNLATPIPVTLDGFSHKVSVAEGQLASIAYTAPEGGGHLTLQLVASATQYENVTSVGAINVSDMTVSLPTVGDGVATPQSISAAGLTTVA
jgi:ABC-2 type transport system ATP-binding protein